ncbi:hypothetical protein CRG98_030163 [Punica granatum]|uniref:Integrase catalytic domain-containing protein n=1 Tax=Punica granatum TaxID=22663 RepID=A0A2I0IZK1_PUNGR|nr:hypothetical protein CRG98_030163 [Punica granatum]
MGIDYKALNKLTAKNMYSITLIADLFDQLGAEGDEHKTACLMHYSSYEFLLMPFSLTNAPTTFCTLMNKENKLYAKRENCAFAQWEVPFLEIMIGGGQDYLSITMPLADMLKKGRAWEWTNRCQVAFDRLKRAVMEELMLVLQDFEKPFEDKQEQKSPVGLPKPLPILERPWEIVSMDFTVSLPKSEGCQTLMVVVDRFSKYATFIPATDDCLAEEVASSS